MNVNPTSSPKLFDCDYFDSNTTTDSRSNIAVTKDPGYTYEHGSIYELDCVEFLSLLPANTVDTVFADPPYNIKKASWDNIGNTDQYINWSLLWIKECSRILKTNGTLYICGITEILADIKRPAMQYFDKCRWLIWYYENKANLGNDWGRSHESILCLRKTKKYTFNIDDIRITYNNHTLKYPQRDMNGKSSQFNHGRSGTWSPNPLGAKPKDVLQIPTTCNGMNEKTKHPTQKPEELLRKLLLASTNIGDLVVDPFSGSGTTAVVASQLQRNFIVNDNNHEYNQMADHRLTNLVYKTIPEWIEYDKNNEKRRKSIK